MSAPVASMEAQSRYAVGGFTRQGVAARICLVVDHPQRDLDGLVLVACELASRGHEVFLVPMYDRQEVFLLVPDLVLVNYARYANAGFLAACHRLGIATGVLDTEGGAVLDMDAYFRNIATYLPGVSLYCLWGPRQMRALGAAVGADLTIDLVVTGCPRYDFAVQPWVGAVPLTAANKTARILINTNFPAIAPRFQSAARERHELVHGMGYDADWIDRVRVEVRAARAGMMDAARVLARRFSHAEIVLRPHPFEDASVYAELEADNVRVVQSGSILEWITGASVVVHHSCSTAVEAFLLGKPVVSIRWLETPIIDQPLPLSVSLSAGSIEELVEIVGASIEGRAPTPQDTVVRARESVVCDFYHAADGEAFARVADAVEEVVSTHRSGMARAKVTLRRALAASGDNWQRLQLAARTVGAAPLLRWLRGRRRRDPAAKHFKAEDVTEIGERLAAVHSPYREVRVRRARRSDASVPTASRLHSVCVQPAPTR